MQDDCQENKGVSIDITLKGGLLNYLVSLAEGDYPNTGVREDSEISLSRLDCSFPDRRFGTVMQTHKS